MDAGKLEVGNEVRTDDGAVLAVVAVRAWTETKRVHNITVDGLHTYYVLAGGTAILVHNTSCGEQVPYAQDKLSEHALDHG